MRKVIGTAMTENEFWELLKSAVARYGFIGLGLGGIDYHRCGKSVSSLTEELSGYEGADFLLVR